MDDDHIPLKDEFSNDQSDIDLGDKEDEANNEQKEIDLFKKIKKNRKNSHGSTDGSNGEMRFQTHSPYSSENG